MKKIFLIFGSCCSLLLIGIELYASRQQTVYSKQLIQLVNQNYTEKIDPELLDSYQEKILLETKDPNSRRDLGQAYYALSLIEHSKGNYYDSIHYLNKILRMGDAVDRTLNILVQEGFAINYLALEDLTQSYFYFKRAEQLVEKLGNEELQGLLYNRYGHTLLVYSDQAGVAINLFENCLTFDTDSKVKLDAVLFLAEGYLMAGLYDRAITYLIRGFELSIINGYEEKQPSILTDLAIAYYLNQNYQLSLNAIEQIYELDMPNAYFPYYSLFMKIAKQVYGDEISESYLANYRPKLDRFDEATFETPSGLNIYQIEWLLHQGKTSEVTEIIDKLDEAELNTYEVVLRYLMLWAQSIDLWEQYQQEPLISESLIEDYGRLYQQAKDLPHSKIKVVLLDEIVKAAVELGNYELGYQHLTYQNSLLSGVTMEVGPDTIQTIMEKIMVEVDDSERIKKQVKQYYGFTAMMATLGVCSFIYNVFQKYVKLKRQTKKQLMMQSITQTLTKEALYEALEVHVEFHHRLTFIMIDIDDFNRYNELYGYLQGDIVLKQMADNIKIVFPTGYITRHYQSFIVVIEGADYDCTGDLKHLFDLVATQNIEYATNLEYKRITISAGVVQGILKSTNDIDTYINQSISKLQLSKKRGKNTFTL